MVDKVPISDTSLQITLPGGAVPDIQEFEIAGSLVNAIARLAAIYDGRTRLVNCDSEGKLLVCTGLKGADSRTLSDLYDQLVAGFTPPYAKAPTGDECIAVAAGANSILTIGAAAARIVQVSAWGGPLEVKDYNSDGPTYNHRVILGAGSAQYIYCAGTGLYLCDHSLQANMLYATWWAL